MALDRKPASQNSAERFLSSAISPWSRDFSPTVADARARPENLAALLAQAEELANVGSWELDLEANTLHWSPHLYKMLGLTPTAGPMPHDWGIERIHPEDRKRALADAEAARVEGRAFENELRFLSVDRGIRIFHSRAIAIRSESGRVVRVRGMSQDVTEQRAAEAKLRRLSQQLLRARDDERRQIARDLHETAGQSLAALKMTLGRIRDALGENNGDQARALLESAAELADAVVREIRTVSYLMHPPMLDEAGLGPTLRWYARGFGERSGIQVEVDIPERVPRQEQEIEITVFRIVQEALTNVHKYSGSHTAHVRLTCNDGEICAEVRDDGCGLPTFSREATRDGALGVGIAGMGERVKRLNGKFEMESAPGKGTTVRVVIPVAARSAPISDQADAARAETKRAG